MSELHVLKVRELGNCLVLTLPKSIRTAFRIKAGGRVTLSQTADGFNVKIGAPPGAAKLKTQATKKSVKINFNTKKGD